MTLLVVLCFALFLECQGKNPKILTVDFEKKAGVDYSPGKKFLITLVVVTFTLRIFFVFLCCRALG